MAGNTNQQSNISESSSDLIRLVSFRVGKEQFAVDIHRVQEINRMMSLTQVPESKPGVRGVINLRGRIVPVLDMRSRMGLEESELTDTARIVVVEINHATVGFIVDSVNEVLEIDSSVIESTPAAASNTKASYVQGVAKLDEGLLILLDLESLMSSDSLEAINAPTADTNQAA